MSEKRILVVDDDRTMVSTLCDILELHGWRAIGSSDGGRAAELVVEHDVQVVLMDVRMPRVDGVEALRRIKMSSPGTRVVLMTAYAARGLLAHAESEGALRILKKPVDVRDLLAFLESTVRDHRPVLVVDDDPGSLNSLCDVLDLHGIAVIRARSLAQALERLDAGEPGAVLLDLKLDDLDPDEVLLSVREVSPSILLLLYSGYPTELARVMEGDSGRLVDASFVKPLHIDDLLPHLDAHRH